MSNTAKVQIPGVGDDGKGIIYDETNDEWDLTGAPVATTTGSQTLTNKTLTTPIITLEQGAAVAPTAEGRIAWDTDDNQLKVGDGAATKTFSDDAVNASTYLAQSAAAELIRDTMGTALVAGTNITITVNDGADTITIAASGGSVTGGADHLALLSIGVS